MKRILRKPKQIGLESMFETRTDAWTAAGLELEIDTKQVHASQRRLLVLVPVLAAVVFAHVKIVNHFRAEGSYSLAHAHYVKDLKEWFTKGQLGSRPVSPPVPANWHLHQIWFTVATVLALLIVGWMISRDVSRVAPALFKRMDPATAGTVGFMIRFATVAATALGALGVAGISLQAIAVGGAFTAVVLGLAAQQTLGNLFAGMVLLSARPFRLGERIRLQAGAVGGSVEGIVSSLGLLYTILARGDDRVMVPNSVVLAAAVVPLREPDAVNVKVRLSAGIRPSHVQAILDENVTTETRSSPTVVLEEIDGDEVVVRVCATPDRRSDGAKLADEIIAVLSNVTGEHRLDDQQPAPHDGARR